jgi:hypothetical protein
LTGFGISDVGPSGCIATVVQNLTLGVLVAKGDNVLGRRTWLWSTETKVLHIVPKAAWHWGVDSNVANSLFEAPLVVCMPSTLMGLCWWRLFNSQVIVGLIWTTRSLQEKIG